MTDSNVAREVLNEYHDLDGPLAGQREIVMRAVRKQQLRHKWFSRTLSTLFWSVAVGGYLLAIIIRNESLVVSAVFWLLMGTIVLVHSRLRRVELKIDEVLATLEGPADNAGARKNKEP